MNILNIYVKQTTGTKYFSKEHFTLNLKTFLSILLQLQFWADIFILQIVVMINI